MGNLDPLNKIGTCKPPKFSAAFFIGTILNKEPPIPSPLYLHPSEAARELRCSEVHLYRLIKRGTIPAVKDGRRTLIRTSAIARYLSTLPNKEFAA